MPESTKLEIGVGSTFYDISDRTNYLHLGNDGLGMAPVKRFTESGPLQDGATDLGYRLQPRVINLVLNLLARTRKEYWTLREQLLRLFTPSDNPLKLRLTYKYTDTVNPDPIQDEGDTNIVKKIRQVDCHLTGGLSLPSDGKQGNFNGHKIALELTAHDPLWYDPNSVTETYTYNDIPGTVDIAYSGTYREYPVITLHGPLNDLVITNTITGDKLDFTGYDIPTYYNGATYSDSGIITVDTRYGYKTVEDGAGVSVLNKLTFDSDLSTFSIEPEPIAGSGINPITISMSNTPDSSLINSTISVAWYKRYTGV